MEQPVPVAAGDAGVGSGEHLPGGDHVEHGQALDLLGMVEGETVGDSGPAVVAGQQGDPPVTEVVDQGPDVGGHGPLVVAGGRLVAQPVAAQVGGEHRVPRGQGADHLAPAVPGLGPAVEQHHQRPVALQHVVQLDAVDQRRALHGVIIAPRLFVQSQPISQPS